MTYSIVPRNLLANRRLLAGSALFDNMLRNLDTAFEGGDFSPSVEIAESEKEYILHAELPGIEEDNIDVNFENGYLTISGEKLSETENTEGEVHHTERSYGKFTRSFSLPADKINDDEISATFKNGVLNVSIPKREEVLPKSKKIQVKPSK